MDAAHETGGPYDLGADSMINSVGSKANVRMLRLGADADDWAGEGRMERDELGYARVAAGTVWHAGDRGSCGVIPRERCSQAACLARFRLCGFSAGGC